MNAILDLLTRNNGSSFAHIITRTDPVRKSKSAHEAIATMFPGHSAIYKLGKRNVSIGNTYSQAVNNRLEKNELDTAGEFKAAPRDWAERVKNSIVKHKSTGEYYVEYYYLNSNKSTYSYHFEDGTELTEEELDKARQLFPKPSTSKKQEAAGLTEEEQVKVNLVKLENVVQLRAFGEVAFGEGMNIYIE